MSGRTSTRTTRSSTISTDMRKVMLALRSTKGKNDGMMTTVKQLAIIIYTVIVAMLPPSFSVTTAAAAAVGQMTQMNTPSSTTFVSVSA